MPYRSQRFSVCKSFPRVLCLCKISFTKINQCNVLTKRFVCLKWYIFIYRPLVQCHLYVLRFAKQKASLYVISCKILLFFQITFIFSIPHIAELSRTELSAWISQLLLLLLVYDYMYAVVMVITFLKLRFRRE